jgi:hypothetical protein
MRTGGWDRSTATLASFPLTTLRWTGKSWEVEESRASWASHCDYAVKAH